MPWTWTRSANGIRKMTAANVSYFSRLTRKALPWLSRLEGWGSVRHFLYLARCFCPWRKYFPFNQITQNHLHSSG